jgi:hypothetical protein
LERLAEILEEYDAPVPLLSRMEYAPAKDRPHLREENSPLSIAYGDGAFRREGLAGDTLGDAMAFFELNDRDAHHLLCYCHYSGSVTSRAVAERARALARKKTLGQMLQSVRLKLFGAPEGQPV